jgi:hypothetical protein
LTRTPRPWPWLLLVLTVAILTGCGDDDGNGDDRERSQDSVTGTFVGEVRGSDTLVAVVAQPGARGRPRDVSVFACDGRRVCALFSGEASENRFKLTASAGDSVAEGTVREKGAAGTVKLRGRDTSRFSAESAAAAAGLYELTVSEKGKITGASASGVGLTGTVKLTQPASGRLKLADGTRLVFRVTRSDSDLSGVRSGQLRVIVLPSGELAGAGRTRGQDSSVFFVRAASQRQK